MPNCLPVAKRELQPAGPCAGGHLGNRNFFLGTFQPPPPAVPRNRLAAPASIQLPQPELCTQVFEQKGALDRLEPFVSSSAPLYGP